MTLTTTLDGGECAASGFVKGSQYPLNRRVFGPIDVTASVGNGNTVIRPVCSLLYDGTRWS